MSVVQRVQALTERVERYQRAKEWANEAALLRDRTRNLSELLDRLNSARSLKTVLANAGFDCSALHLGALSKLLEAYCDADDERKADRWTALATGLKKAVDKAERSAESDVEKAKKLTLDALPSAGTLDQYALDPATREAAQALLDRREQLAQGRWNDPNRLPGLLAEGKSLTEACKALLAQGASPQTLKFLELARSAAGASLDELSDKVRVELHERNLLEHVRLVLR